nr:type II toxin-antitoxin system RelE/ParE family toxin [Ectothiorhodospira shaposhnikovii]
MWCYRVGNYLVTPSIEDHEIRILVLRVGHRSTVYR